MLDELLDLEHQGWMSLCNSTGADFYGQIMTSDGVMVLAHGQVFDRQAVIDSLNQAPPWRTYDIVDERLIALSDDHAILVYTGRAYRDEDELFLDRRDHRLGLPGRARLTAQPQHALDHDARLGRREPAPSSRAPRGDRATSFA